MEGNRAEFFIEDSTTANALFKVSRKITDKEGYKVLFFFSSPQNRPLVVLSIGVKRDISGRLDTRHEHINNASRSFRLSNKAGVRVNRLMMAINKDGTINK